MLINKYTSKGTGNKDAYSIIKKCNTELVIGPLIAQNIGFLPQRNIVVGEVPLISVLEYIHILVKKANDNNG